MNQFTQKDPEPSVDSEYHRIVHELAFAALNEQRTKRRWRTFFIILTFIYLTPSVLLMSGVNLQKWFTDTGGDGRHTAKVELSGPIVPGQSSSAEQVIKGLTRAFKDKKTAGVILEINSPGGSPVQSAYIYDAIQHLRTQYPNMPLYAVVEDVAASGGYFVASAADKIFVNRSSMVGSIGVRMDNFGAVNLIDKLGIERRLLTAGEHKGLMDPFLPLNEAQQQNVQTLLTDVHRHFIEAVRTGRGERLNDHVDLFTGLVWSGEKAMELGLVDDYGSTYSVAQEVVGESEIKDFTPLVPLIERLARGVGATLGSTFVSVLWANRVFL
jgi:protease-4